MQTESTSVHVTALGVIMSVSSFAALLFQGLAYADSTSMALTSAPSTPDGGTRGLLVPVLCAITACTGMALLVAGRMLRGTAPAR
jgi:hypothetical protein